MAIALIIKGNDVDFSENALDQVDLGIPATGISLNKDSATITNTGLTETLVATLTPSDATSPITWTSSDDDIATVTNGVVTAVGLGTATITATSNGHTATCTITTKAFVVIENAVKVDGANIAKQTTLEQGGNGIGGFTTNGGTSRAGICTTGNGLTVGSTNDSTNKGFRIPVGAKSISVTNPESSHLGLISVGFFDADKYPVSGYETRATAIQTLSWSSRDASYVFNIPEYTGDFSINVVTFAFREYIQSAIDTDDLDDLTIEFLTTTVT